MDRLYLLVLGGFSTGASGLCLSPSFLGRHSLVRLAFALSTPGYQPVDILSYTQQDVIPVVPMSHAHGRSNCMCGTGESLPAYVIVLPHGSVTYLVLSDTNPILTSLRKKVHFSSMRHVTSESSLTTPEPHIGYEGRKKERTTLLLVRSFREM